MNKTNATGHRDVRPQHARLRSNNFDLLRLLFAGAVCMAHCYVLSGFPELRIVAEIFSSTVAVKAFFVVSGFLIFMSFERSTSLSTYLERRARRIYPVYFTVVLGFAIALVVVSSKPASDYFSPAWFKYVVANLGFLNFLKPTLPGVFDQNEMNAVNGALWTLKIEVMFYLAVPAFVVLMRRFSVLSVLGSTYFASLVYVQILQHLGGPREALYAELARQLPGQLSYFMAGAFFYYHLPLLERYTGRLLFAAIAVLAIDLAMPLTWLEPLALATVVVFLGLFLYVGNFSRFGDFSYGLYIVHFPIIQLLLDSGRFAGQPWLLLGAALACSLAVAVALWHIVEKRWLARGNHYVARGRDMPPRA